MPRVLRPYTLDRVWEQVNRAPGLGRDGECWEWTGYLNENNYGYIKWEVDGDLKTMAVHRVVAFLCGWLDLSNPRAVVRHTCDNTKCCRPAHLLVGTQKENVRDSMDRGTFVPGPGARKKEDRFTGDQVRYIRNSDQSTVSLAKVFGVNRITIGRIKRRVFYTDVPDFI